MKVLFISSGNTKEGISTIVKNQGESLRKAGIDIHFYCIKGKGITGYLGNIKRIRKYYQKIKPDIVHAHYSLSAILTNIAGFRPIVSLMGSDIKKNTRNKIKLFLFYKFLWKKTIVKSCELKNALNYKKVYIIPNGVDLEKFRPLPKIECSNKLLWSKRNINILFAANPLIPVKNYELAIQSLALIKEFNIKLHTLSHIPHDEVPLIMNAADIVLLTSIWEGSPNVIKEAMACNRPIVATSVGDIKWLFGDEPGNYLTTFEPENVSNNVKKAIEYSKKYGSTNSRERLINMGIDSANIAKQLIILYEAVVKK